MNIDPFNKYLLTQKEICKKYGTSYYPAHSDSKIGISNDVVNNNYPINGLRTNPITDTSGWYIWAGEGELSTDDNYFKPLHIIHLPGICPEVMKFLGLPPGWRFLIAANYEDVWFDEKLTSVY